MAKKIIIFALLLVMVFSLCGCTSSGKAFIKNYYGYFGLCDEDGDYIIKPKYNQMIGLSDDRYLVCVHSKPTLKICVVVDGGVTDSEFVDDPTRIYTIINRKDKVIETLEDVAYVEEIADGVIVVLKNVKRNATPQGPEDIVTYGYVSADCYVYDSTMSLLNSKPWKAVRKFGEDKLVVTNEKDISYLTDFSLNYVSTKGYDDIYYINDELCGIVEKSKHGIMNMKGEVLVEPKYTEPTMAVNESLLAVGTDKKYNLVSSQSFESTSEVTFSQIDSFNYYGVARIVIDEDGKVRYGLVNKDGKTVIDFGTYAYISQFSGGKAVACVADHSTNAFENTTIKLLFDVFPDMGFEYPENNNYADYRAIDNQPSDASWVLIDAQGNVIREATREDISQYDIR